MRKNVKNNSIQILVRQLCEDINFHIHSSLVTSDKNLANFDAQEIETLRETSRKTCDCNHCSGKHA